MDKNKLNRIGIIIFIIVISIFAVFSGYVFFNNSSNLEVSIRSNNEQMKRDVAVNEALTKILVDKNDTISNLTTKIDKIVAVQKKDSISLVKKNKEIKKLEHEKDSLAEVIRNYRWSDIEPVTTKPNN